MSLSFPFSVGFGVLCGVGTFVAVSSSDWLGVWLGLELNLMGFVPLMLQGGGNQAVEGSIKYFLVQSLGSGFLLLGGFGSNVCFWFCSFSSGSMMVLCLVGLGIKLGLAPFHWWVPSVMASLSWFGCGFLLTWQKVGPFIVFVVFSDSFLPAFLILGGFSAVVGGLCGIGQVQVRLLMAYSSISHWGWIVSVSGFSVLAGIFYYLFYFFVSAFLFYAFSYFGVWVNNQVNKISGIVVVLAFLSLAGVPPFSGFVGKWVGLQVLMGYGSFLVSFFLILGSILSLYYYLSFLFLFLIGFNSSYGSGDSKYYRFGVGLSLVVFLGGFPFYEIFYFVL